MDKGHYSIFQEAQLKIKDSIIKEKEQIFGGGTCEFLPTGMLNLNDEKNIIIQMLW